jgi:hypothetical protein
MSGIDLLLYFVIGGIISIAELLLPLLIIGVIGHYLLTLY